VWPAQQINDDVDFPCKKEPFGYLCSRKKKQLVGPEALHKEERRSGAAGSDHPGGGTGKDTATVRVCRWRKEQKRKNETRAPSSTKEE